jgi:Xaa-Pro aminopeptidase
MEGFFHGLGHGVGLDIHEAPSLKVDKEGLKPGMVLAVEPALYYPGIGGVREEDLVVVREGGIENLSKLEHAFEV